MARTLIEPVDQLPFGSLEKSRRYDSDRYTGAVGLNWYRSDPTLQFLMRMHLTPEGLPWAEPRRGVVGALLGGPRAGGREDTAGTPPRLERYDRWGHDISRVVMPPTFEASKRDLLANSFSSPRFQREARAAGADPRLLAAAW